MESMQLINCITCCVIMIKTVLFNYTAQQTDVVVLHYMKLNCLNRCQRLSICQLIMILLH